MLEWNLEKQTAQKTHFSNLGLAVGRLMTVQHADGGGRGEPQQVAEMGFASHLLCQVLFEMLEDQRSTP